MKQIKFWQYVWFETKKIVNNNEVWVKQGLSVFFKFH